MKTTEKKVSHTPGPWTFDREDMNVYNEIGTGIATIHRKAKVAGVDDLEKSGLSLTTKANAKLITAAPELLKALQGLTIYFEFMVKDPGFKEYVDAIEAIKKATE